jgi:hypothetical protein
MDLVTQPGRDRSSSTSDQTVRTFYYFPMYYWIMDSRPFNRSAFSDTTASPRVCQGIIAHFLVTTRTAFHHLEILSPATLPLFTLKDGSKRQHPPAEFPIQDSIRNVGHESGNELVILLA